MATATSTPTQTQENPELSRAMHRAQRRRAKTAGRKKRTLKLRTDKEFAKNYFAAKSKRSNDKKSAYRKRKSKKK